LAVFFLAVFFLAGFRLAVFFFAAFFFAMSNSYRGRRPKTLMLTPPSEGATAEEGRNNRCTFSPSV
jgi:predicted membrane protein